MPLGLTDKQIAAIDAVVDIALHGGAGPVQSSEITNRQGIPRRYLEPVLQRLSRGGILVGIRGPAGGYRLARERRRITLGDLLRAMDGDGAGEAAGAKPRSSPVQSVVGLALGEIEAEFLARLDAITVEALCWRAQGGGRPKTPSATMDFSI
ncbi:MAG: Rrf2 family transcriptional regulator [Rhodospirillaceae bacterium]|jgi:Rrf2 family transcriptional regulator, iron-sulfur cluster assembly transcription factor|nr:Rrf2 family transcriptional regulator [Rhodospirillaceae bacterium]